MKLYEVYKDIESSKTWARFDEYLHNEGSISEIDAVNIKYWGLLYILKGCILKSLIPRGHIPKGYSEFLGATCMCLFRFVLIAIYFQFLTHPSLDTCN